MRVCCDCYGIEEESVMFRCAKCGKFMCANCNCKCVAPEKKPADEAGLAGNTLAGRAVKRVGKAIAGFFT
jgi:hypothetical protein